MMLITIVVGSFKGAAAVLQKCCSGYDDIVV
jgi:hypothetical protein